MPVWSKAKIGKPAETEEKERMDDESRNLAIVLSSPKLLPGPSICSRQSTDKFNRTNAVDTNWNKGRCNHGRRQQAGRIHGHVRLLKSVPRRWFVGT
jgi:hypothetical protein